MSQTAEAPRSRGRELTITEVCQELRRSRGYVIDLIHGRVKGRTLRYRREGREYRINERDLHSYIESTYIPVEQGDNGP